MEDSFERRIIASLTRRHGPGDGAVPWNRADFVHVHGTALGALLYSVLFVPELIEVEGHVFLKELGPKADGGWEAVAAGIIPPSL